MPFTDLGNKVIAVEDGFVSYNSFRYKPGDYYAGLISFSSDSPDFIYSTFHLRIGYPIVDNPTATTNELLVFQYSDRPQFFGLGLPKGFQNDQQLTLEVARRAFYSDPSQLANVSVSVKINLDDKLDKVVSLF